MLAGASDAAILPSGMGGFCSVKDRAPDLTAALLFLLGMDPSYGPTVAMSSDPVAIAVRASA